MILVTGGSGYIGSHTVVALINSGFEVIIADNLCNSHAWIVDHIEQITGKRPVFVNVDLTDALETEKIFKEYAIDGIIHFAAYKAVGESVTNPIKYYQNNLFSLINLLALSKQYSVG